MRAHTTHHESCGCCEAERDALKAQVERMREALVVADALIRKLFSGKVADTGAGEVGLAIAVALYATPAQSLAAHDAEVRAKALRDVEPWARFGSWAFEMFWHDSEPGDIDAADAQERAVEFGLLARTSECDAGATHAEECDWQPGMPLSECCCVAPCRAPLRLAERAPEVER